MRQNVGRCFLDSPIGLLLAFVAAILLIVDGGGLKPSCPRTDWLWATVEAYGVAKDVPRGVLSK